jgi:threonine/homoserine/homoserine lactone efflux protein
MDLLAFLLFSVATSGTPGPNNIMVSAAAANHGFRATIPHILGIAVGLAVMLLVFGSGLAGPLAADPRLHRILRWVGVAWMLWLAAKIAFAEGPLSGGRGRPPLSFLGAVLFQWINPKAWLIALATVATYTTAEGSLYRQVALLALLSFLVSIPCVAAWAALGAGASRFLMTPRRLRLFNVAMALLLVASLVPLLRD